MKHPVPIDSDAAEQVVRFARGIVTGALGVIEGARKISAVRLYAGHVNQPIDLDYCLFGEIAMRTSHLPLGESRKHWSPDVLPEKDAELRRLEEIYREPAFRAAHKLVQRLENA